MAKVIAEVLEPNTLSVMSLLKADFGYLLFEQSTPEGGQEYIDTLMDPAEAATEFANITGVDVMSEEPSLVTNGTAVYLGGCNI